MRILWLASTFIVCGQFLYFPRIKSITALETRFTCSLLLTFDKPVQNTLRGKKIRGWNHFAAAATIYSVNENSAVSKWVGWNFSSKKRKKKKKQ